MALSRRKWNNIIIIACIFMVAILTLLKEEEAGPAQALFDDSAQLAQLQMGNRWLQRSSSGWQCDDEVTNCAQWATTWEQLKVTHLKQPPTTEQGPSELLIQIKGINEPQLWQLYIKQGLLKSPAGNWFQIDPQQQSAIVATVGDGTNT